MRRFSQTRRAYTELACVVGWMIADSDGDGLANVDERKLLPLLLNED